MGLWVTMKIILNNLRFIHRQKIKPKFEKLSTFFKQKFHRLVHIYWGLIFFFRISMVFFKFSSVFSSEAIFLVPWMIVV